MRLSFPVSCTPYDYRSYRRRRLYDFESPIPSAPPLEQMEEVAGYERTTFSEEIIPPPIPVNESLWDDEALNHSSDVMPGIHVTEKVARDALIDYAKTTMCYGTKAARDMALTSFKYSSVYHYELQTFTEKRQTSWKFFPYCGSVVDDSENGPPPLPWEISADPSKLFSNEQKVITVPHTQSVKLCHACKGTGNIPCINCSGKGWTYCHMCSRNGYERNLSSDQRCLACAFSHHGTGRQDCIKCFSKGKVTCSTCKGHCHLLYYIALTVTWKVITAEHIVDNSLLPEHLVRDVTGQVQYEEEGSRVMPILDNTNEAIRIASMQYIRDHLDSNRNQKVLAQRQQVRMIPITTVEYNWNGKEGEFQICGFENEVHAPDYPQKFCCGCSIL